MHVLVKVTPELKKIILYRADRLGLYVSNQIALQVNKWDRFNTSNYQVEVSVADFLEYERTLKCYYHSLATEITKASQNYLLIEYNRDFLNKTNLNATLTRLQEFIGIKVVDLEALYNKGSDLMKKKSQVHVSKQISNWESLPMDV